MNVETNNLIFHNLKFIKNKSFIYRSIVGQNSFCILFCSLGYKIVFILLHILNMHSTNLKSVCIISFSDSKCTGPTNGHGNDRNSTSLKVESSADRGTWSNLNVHILLFVPQSLKQWHGISTAESTENCHNRLESRNVAMKIHRWSVNAYMVIGLRKQPKLRLIGLKLIGLSSSLVIWRP
jgi:hypothetical protein